MYRYQNGLCYKKNKKKSKRSILKEMRHTAQNELIQKVPAPKDPGPPSMWEYFHPFRLTKLT